MPAFILELAAQNPAPSSEAAETGWDTLQERLFLDDPIGAREAAWALIQDGVGCRVQAAGEVWPLRSAEYADVLGLPLELPRSLLVGGFEVPLVWDGVRARLFAADCAEEVMGWFEAQCPLDTRLREALVVIRESAWGRGTEDALRAARVKAAEVSWGLADKFAQRAASAVAEAAHEDPKQAAQGAAHLTRHLDPDLLRGQRRLLLTYMLRDDAICDRNPTAAATLLEEAAEQRDWVSVRQAALTLIQSGTPYTINTEPLPKDAWDLAYQARQFQNSPWTCHEDALGLLGLPAETPRWLWIKESCVPMLWSGAHARMFAADCTERALHALNLLPGRREWKRLMASTSPHYIPKSYDYPLFYPLMVSRLWATNPAAMCAKAAMIEDSKALIVQQQQRLWSLSTQSEHATHITLRALTRCLEVDPQQHFDEFNGCAEVAEMTAAVVALTTKQLTRAQLTLAATFPGVRDEIQQARRDTTPSPPTDPILYASAHGLERSWQAWRQVRYLLSHLCLTFRPSP